MNKIFLLKRLIINDFRKRIGFKSINELKKHYWFKDFDWKKFEKRKFDSPLGFIPKKKKRHCKSYNLTEKKKNSFSFNKIILRYNFVNKQIIRNIYKISKAFR